MKPNIFMYKKKSVEKLLFFFLFFVLLAPLKPHAIQLAPAAVLAVDGCL